MTVLRLEQVLKRFEGLTAIDRCSLKVERGSIHGLIGPNGAGKTTLFNIISGLDRPTEGRILFKDREMTRLRPHEINRFGIARTFQLISLFGDMSVLENVMVGRHARTGAGLLASIVKPPWVKEEEQAIRARAREILEFVGLERLDEKLPLPARHLPYGEQRLLEIARAIASEPELLLLDEPAAGMNPAEKKRLEGIVHAIRDRGATVFFVEHDMNLAMSLADRITVLDQGKIIAEGTAADIQRDETVMEAYLGKKE
jgi:branched-chain amino acid transport system ATP-binding protein